MDVTPPPHRTSLAAGTAVCVRLSRLLSATLFLCATSLAAGAAVGVAH